MPTWPDELSTKRPRFSIVTVCFNALQELPETHASLRGQSCRDYEWVVVDGASTDGTVQLIAQCKPDVFVSEPDAGIFDAMNKAIQLCSGEWVYFLNAGDRFADEAVLSSVAKLLDSESAGIDIVYGDVVYFGSSGNRRKKFDWLTPHRLVYGDLCHQAVFCRGVLFLSNGSFDTTLKFNADFDWLLRVVRNGAKMAYLPRAVAYFHDAGTHVTHRSASERERMIVRLRFSSWFRWFLGHWTLRAQLYLRRRLGRQEHG